MVDFREYLLTIFIVGMILERFFVIIFESFLKEEHVKDNSDYNKAFYVSSVIAGIIFYAVGFSFLDIIGLLDETFIVQIFDFIIVTMSFLAGPKVILEIVNALGYVKGLLKYKYLEKRKLHDPDSFKKPSNPKKKVKTTKTVN